ncbi:hypothetical protein [Paraburkholderia sp. HD33-4]|uniref:hypothetical protein n=1 Tax=Paraburkholderia sp. HD33-4 TaxID=2883242 RepID=UPI001F1FF185|nr:hypothetical protein [Paraburkholderia sp. HD33-4]
MSPQQKPWPLYQFLQRPFQKPAGFIKLEAALSQSKFVAIYGLVFDDGGPDGKGVHETHFNSTPEDKDKDGAVVVYNVDANQNPSRTWFFFKFVGDQITT